MPLIEAIPPVRGRRGRPRQRPDRVYADRGYDHDKYRRQVRAAGITPVIARRSTEHGSGLGVHRWVVEQSFALLHWFRRLRDPPGDPRRHPRGLPQPRLRHHLLAPPAQPLTLLGPLSADFLRAAAPGYCTSQQQAEALDNWFEQALAYATEKLHGAVAALSPASAGIMGQVSGYIVADYLVQHASRERRYCRVPASTWDALVCHIGDPADAARLADSARNRLLYRYAISLYRHAADAGDGSAASRLARLLAQRGDLDGLRSLANADEWYVIRELADLLARRGDLDGLRAQANAGNGYAAGQLARLLADRGDLDELRARADAGDEDAAWRLAGLLPRRGDLDEAEQILRARADAGDWRTEGPLADLLIKQGRSEEAGRLRRFGLNPDGSIARA